MNIKKEHLSLIRKIADFTNDEGWTDDAVIHLITCASVQWCPSGVSGGDEILRAFEYPTDIVNLCYLIEHHYNLEIVCRKVIEYRK